MTRRPVCLLCLLLIMLLCLGDRLGFSLIRGNPLPEDLQAWIESNPDASLCGEVEASADTVYSHSVYLKQTYLIYRSKRVPIESVRVFLKEKREIPVGTVLLVSGKLERIQPPRNPGEFDSRQYYACRHIYYTMKDGKIEKASASYSRYGQLLADLRQFFTEVLEKCTGEAAGVFDAIVLGEKNFLEEETKLRYQAAGIIHILAISGLHISILGIGLYQLLKKVGLGIWGSGLISLVIMLQYGMMTGGTVSTMRAVCMFLISVGAKVLGRIYDMMTALAVAAILILWESPAYLYDGGFLLSFTAVLGAGTAVLGAGTVLPMLREILGEKTGKGKIWSGLLSSVSIQLATLPVMLWFYGEVSLAGIFMNLLVLPTVGAVLVSGLGAALLGAVWIPAGIAAGMPGRGILWGYEKLCAWVGQMPFLTWIGGRPKVWEIVVYYGLLYVGLAVGRKTAQRMRRESAADDAAVCISGSGVRAAETIADGVSGKILTAAAAPVLTVGFLCAAIGILGYRSEEGFRLTCLDVGQGDAAVAEIPSGEVLLIDGGSSNKSATGLYQILPYLKYRGINYIDAVFVSHTDEDHINGLRQLLEMMGKGLTAVRTGCLVLPEWSSPPEEWEELRLLAEKAGGRVETAHAGEVFRAGDASVKVVSPLKGASGESVNEDAMVLQLECGGLKCLFTGDIGAETEKNMLSQVEDVDILKVAHHGSRYSSCAEFLEKASAEIAVVSCSSTNTYGHPSAETIERLEAAGCQVEYTMKSGAITITAKKEGDSPEIRRFCEVTVHR